MVGPLDKHIHIIYLQHVPGIVAYDFSSSTWEAEAGASIVSLRQPGLHKMSSRTVRDT